MKSLYLIGSLRNPKIPQLANNIEALGIEAFADWHAAGPTADDEWQRYEKERGRSYAKALKGHAARNVFKFDECHLARCDAAVLVMPGGKSAHLEIGYILGQGKPGYVLFDQEPERWDVMYQFATEVFFSEQELLAHLKQCAAAL
jgi:nucleoside 2-deoxyribosyltransferase